MIEVYKIFTEKYDDISYHMMIFDIIIQLDDDINQLVDW